MPKTNTNFWEEKLARNRERDKQYISQLSTAGWKVLVLWECEVKDHIRLKRTLLEFIPTVP